LNNNLPNAKITGRLISPEHGKQKMMGNTVSYNMVSNQEQKDYLAVQLANQINDFTGIHHLKSSNNENMS
jgi:hypothetical protein